MHGLKGSRATFGHFEVTAQGVSQTNAAKRLRLSVDLDMSKRTVTFTQSEGRKTPIVLLKLRSEELRAPSFRIEKSLEDSRTLYLVDYFDKVIKSERTSELIFQSHVERELFFLATQHLRDAPIRATLRVFTGTFNMGSTPPNSLDSWIPFGCDIYCIGSQVLLLCLCFLSVF